MKQPRFHLAFPVNDLETTRSFYMELLGCSIGRTSERWIDFDFAGHQITAHLVARSAEDQESPNQSGLNKPDHSQPNQTGDAGPMGTNAVDGDQVPVPHFGLILQRPEWDALAARLTDAKADFIIKPRVRFEGQVGEQATLFVRDPSGNCLEFKAFGDDAAIFAS